MVHNSLWHNKNFIKLWSSETISVFGSEFTGFAIPLIAVLTLNASATEMGFLVALESVPFLLIGLFVGVWVDRGRKKPILIISNLGRALLLITIPIAITLGFFNLYFLFVIVFLIGSLTVFFDVAYQSYLPNLVQPDQLVEANSKLESSRSGAFVIGPSIAGLLLELVSAAFVILFDAVSFFISALLLFQINDDEQNDKSPQTSSILSEALEGISIIIRDPILRSLVGCSATLSFFHEATLTLYFLYATREMGLSAITIGIAATISNIASLVAALIASKLVSWIGLGRTLITTAIIIGLSNIFLVFAQPATGIIMLIAYGYILNSALIIYNINSTSLRQTITPADFLGRINATTRFIVWGLIPIAALTSGYLGDAIGLRTTILIATIGASTASLWLWFSPVRNMVSVTALEPSN